MNGSRAASLTLSWRFAALRVGNFPIIPTAIIVGLALVAIFADVIAPYNPEVGVLGDRFRPPFWQAGGTDAHLLGTDHLGRDVLSRLIFGARISMVVGFTAVIFAGVLGTGLGILSGYLGGWVDQVIMRVTDTWLALPARHPRRGALPEGARLRPPRHRGRLLQADDHAQAHPAQRAQLRHRARHAHAGRGHRPGGRPLLPRRGRAAPPARLGADAGRRQEGHDGRLLV